MRFEDLVTTRKGDIGERIVKEWMRRKEWFVYCPDVGRHPIDFVCYSDPNKLFFVDVKTYPRRAKYNDTGIDKRDWVKYSQIALKWPVWLLFVDEFEGCCYGGSLSDLDQKKTEKSGKVYFPLSCFKVLFWLSLDDLKLISITGEPLSGMYRDTERWFDR